MGSLLRTLPVPEHADDFFDRLGDQLRAESVLTPDEPSDVRVIDLSVRRTARPRSRRGFQQVMRSAVAPVGAVACFALVVGGGQFARTTVEERRERSAARTLAVTVQPYVAATSGLRVKFHTTDRNGVTSAYDTVISPTGDYHLSRISPRYDANFDARSGSRTIYDAKANVSGLQSGLADGPPDGPEPVTPNGALSRDLGAAVRAIAADNPAAVQKATWTDTAGRERPALEHTETGGGGTLFDYQLLRVDEGSGIPVEIEQRKSGIVVRRVVVDELSETPLLPAVLAPDIEGHASGIPDERPFRATTLADAANSVGYPIELPRYLPAGFSLSRVSVAPLVAPINQDKVTYADVVTLLYRDQLESYTVSLRRVPNRAPGVPPVDPIAEGSPLPPAAETARITEGALAGVDVHVGISAVLWPHVWAEHDGVLVTIAGDLTRAQLLRVTASLQRYAPPPAP